MAYNMQQQPQYPSMYPSNQQTVYTSQPMQSLMMFGDYPTSLQCPQCRSQITTNLQFKNGAMTWIACVGLFFVGCSLGCCLIPFCVDSCKDAYHTCPSCNSLIGMKKRI